MASSSAIRFIASSTSKSTFGSIQLQCHVKPGASKQREGVLSINDDTIEICVAAHAREGEANKAVRNLISDVLKVPKSEVEVIRGHKSRDKTLAVTGIDPQGDEQSCIDNIRKKLQESAE